jgi:hypothetical protein
MFGQFNRFRGPIIRLKGIKYTELSRRMGQNVWFLEKTALRAYNRQFEAALILDK